MVVRTANILWFNQSPFPISAKARMTVFELPATVDQDIFLAGNGQAVSRHQFNFPRGQYTYSIQALSEDGEILFATVGSVEIIVPNAIAMKWIPWWGGSRIWWVREEHIAAAKADTFYGGGLSEYLVPGDEGEGEWTLPEWKPGISYNAWSYAPFLKGVVTEIVHSMGAVIVKGNLPGPLPMKINLSAGSNAFYFLGPTGIVGTLVQSIKPFLQGILGLNTDGLWYTLTENMTLVRDTYIAIYVSQPVVWTY